MVVTFPTLTIVPGPAIKSCPWLGPVEGVALTCLIDRPQLGRWRHLVNSVIFRGPLTIYRVKLWDRGYKLAIISIIYTMWWKVETKIIIGTKFIKNIVTYHLTVLVCAANIRVNHSY